METKARVWTTDQLRAISYPADAGKPVLVSAAAGSGKTAVLVERVVRLLTCDEPVRADRIVLVTFTRKAATEMKTRLEAALSEMLNKRPDSPLIREQLIRLEAAQITTINAFCLHLLRENAGAAAKYAGVQPGFKIIAEGEESGLLMAEAMTDTLEAFYEGNSDEIQRIIAFFGANGDSGLQSAIRGLYEFSRKLPDSSEWLTKQVSRYADPDLYGEELLPEYRRLVGADIERAMALTERSLEVAESERAVALLREDLDFFADYEDLGGNSAYPRANAHSLKGESDDAKETIKTNRELTKKIAAQVMEAAVLAEHFSEAVTCVAPVVTTLVGLTRLYVEKYSAVKRAHKVIDFADTEHMCLQLLREGGMVCDYDVMIVDEFQDSNFLQYELFRLLDGGVGRVFFVGDVKQSIYRFRGADSAVFDQVMLDPDYETLYLSVNFRSSVQVIDGVNRIFERVMSEYDDKARLSPKPDAEDKADLQTEFCLLDENSYDGLSGAEAEATYTARRIKAMVEGGDFKYEDFAVLSSTGERNFKVYEAVFRELGVPCVSAGGGGYLTTDEVGLALDLLMVINNPYNDLSLFNVMMSPLYGFTAQEIAAIRAGRVRAGNRTIPLYSAVLMASKADISLKAKQEISPKGGLCTPEGRILTLNKTSAFLQSLTHYRRVADVSSAAELIAVINGEGGFLPLLTDNHKRANVRLLSYYAEQFTATRTDSGLPAFLTYIKELQHIGVDVRQANVNTQMRGCVRLMTIHASKGLEFPVCFVARTNQDYNKRGGGKGATYVKFDEEAGIAADWLFEEKDGLCRFKSLVTDYAARREREQSVSEEMRKLYVAATRAQRKLIFTGYTKTGEVCDTSYAAWIDGNVRSATCDDTV
ncbi:MAG: UvrD-helicase domain-containing protein, partial [Oscillospiraceae bacterium]|nr:UvrD-helicase domain-containing protein [Oscillospiraceae bacterium]